MKSPLAGAHYARSQVAMTERPEHLAPQLKKLSQSLARIVIYPFNLK
jgi:hypothetical protein